MPPMPTLQEINRELRPSLPEAFSSVRLTQSPGFWRRLFGFLGPGFLISVGYMDPGNWATDLAGGSKYGYTLLFVIMLSNLMAILLQSLALKLGIATERDLAQSCRETYSRPTNILLWLFAEIAIGACDLAEVIGSAIALQLLFHIPLMLGVLITGTDVLLILLLQNRGFRYLEALVITLIGTIAALFGVEVLLSHPEWLPIARNLVIPSKSIITNPDMLYIAIGILGATVMPHNLYLHSSIVQTRNYPRTEQGKREAIRFANIDSATALMLALFVNAAILILAAAVFHRAGHYEVAEIGDAYKLLTPMLGFAGASTMFALALLASGQNSTITGTLAGQIVMEGFLHIRLAPWLRRLITRSLAIIPTIVVTYFYGERGTANLLVLSQVILSMQLSFAVFPLVAFTSNPAKMGPFVNHSRTRLLSYAVAFLIAGLNLWLLIQIFRGH
ncbi:Nramp family divalent metal transporter [Tunturibacter empetritectus]|uniref:Divalent metal cation transporter MntH n=2 Tax=Tunturiibacter empetritectus TaxID=3069691 RepID=A0A7W8IHI1_9BACT|nr:Nramp family divalent metal transporter [Edaphobacter lichenicola]MBB5317152.1 manganese transport protein [Edaphobacter lichenicola]